MRVADAKATLQNGPLDTRKKQFAYSEIVSMTNNFERILGEGGFGKVFYGYVNNTQVAVKMLSASSFQGYHEFQAEARNYYLIYTNCFKYTHEFVHNSMEDICVRARQYIYI